MAFLWDFNAFAIAETTDPPISADCLAEAVHFLDKVIERRKFDNGDLNKKLSKCKVGYEPREIGRHAQHEETIQKIRKCRNNVVELRWRREVEMISHEDKLSYIDQEIQKQSADIQKIKPSDIHVDMKREPHIDTIKVLENLKADISISLPADATSDSI